MRLRHGLLILVLATSTMPSTLAVAQGAAPTWKQKQEASSHFKAGLRAFMQHKYVEAAESFEKAHEVLPSHKALFNAADAWEKAGELVKAALRFRQFLQEAPEDAKARDDAQARLESILTKISRLNLAGQGATDIQVNGQPAKLGEMLITPGDHVVTASVDGEFVEKRVSLEAGALLRVLIEPPPPEPVPEPEPEERTIDQGVEKKGMDPTLFYVGIGVTTVLAGATGWSGLDTQARRDDFDENPTGTGYDEGVAAQKRTNVLLGLSIAAGVTTAALGLFAVKWDDGTQADVALSPHAAAVRLRF
jgi:hypothetical protein